MSAFWSGWIIILTVGNILGCVWLIWWTMRRREGESVQGDVTGHTWDGDLQEYNNPLPRWWLWLFYITLVFGAGYLTLYPGLGKFGGVLGWTSHGSMYEGEMQQAAEKYDPIFKQYAAVAVTDLATKAEYQEAREMGKRLFLTYCMQCHGSDAGGSRGFPNLTDEAWLWGGTPEQIQVSIANGRNGMMPPHAHIGDDKIDQVATYVMSLSGRDVDAAKAESRQGSLHDGRLYRLPWPGRHRQPDAGRSQPDRQELAVWRQRRGHQADPEQGPRWRHAGTQGPAR